MELTSQSTLSGLLFTLTLVLGLWLSRNGKPYNSILFNVHKLAALGAVILASVQFYNFNKAEGLSALLVILILFAAGCVIGLFFSGAMMSLDQLNYAVMRAIHRAAPVLLVVIMAAAIYLLGG
jgi:hypothetical protein